MAQTVLITLTSAGTDTGPFDLYSNLDGFSAPFETGVLKSDLLTGYVSSSVPNEASTIRVKSSGVLCQNYVDLEIPNISTTTTSSTSTTSSTTTVGSVIYNLINNSTETIVGVNISGGGSLVGGTFPLAPSNSTSGYITPPGIYDITVYGLKGIEDVIKCTFRGSNLATQCDSEGEEVGNNFDLTGFSVRCLDEQPGISVDVIMTVEDGAC